MRLEIDSPGESREKLAGALEIIKEVESDLYRQQHKHGGLTQVCQELVEASEGIDRSIEQLDEIILGVDGDSEGLVLEGD